MSALCFSFIALSFCTFFFLSFYFVVCTLTTLFLFFFFVSRRRHTRYIGDWSSDVCSSDLGQHDAPELAACGRDAEGGRDVPAGVGAGEQRGDRAAGQCAAHLVKLLAVVAVIAPQHAR